MNHKQKLLIARKLITKDELKKKTGIFQSLGWENRKKDIQDRVKRSEDKQKKNHE